MPPSAETAPARRSKRKLRKKRSTGQRRVPEWQALPLASWVHAHLRWAEVSRLAPMSLVLRQRGLARFVAWAHERGLRHPRELTRQVLEAYQRHLYLARSQRDGAPLGLRTQAVAQGAVGALGAGVGQAAAAYTGIGLASATSQGVGTTVATAVSTAINVAMPTSAGGMKAPPPTPAPAPAPKAPEKELAK